MSLKLRDLTILESRNMLADLPEGKLLINTVNAHSFNTAQKDPLFAEALLKGDVLIPDGISIVWACKTLKTKSIPRMRCAGWDLFSFEMVKLEKESKALLADCKRQNLQFTPKRVMFVGSSDHVLQMIKTKAASSYPSLEILTYSPPYKPEFSAEDNSEIIKSINEANPDLLWIGMTAPKQEKWVWSHWQELNIHCHVGTIGAVFDFFAGTRPRSPEWFQEHGLEWFFRLLLEPHRMWRRYVLGNPLFVWYVLKEKIWG